MLEEQGDAMEAVAARLKAAKSSASLFIESIIFPLRAAGTMGEHVSSVQNRSATRR